jgi:acyl-CoA synthetase (AMP-forming)/AMP-acid ligase II
LPRKLGSIGRAIPNGEIDIITDAGKRARAGEIGELVARGPNISCGYWNRPEETERKFGPLGYRTGDLGYADADGYLFLVGRLHDMIKVGGLRVGAKEIEDVLFEHSSVLDAAVVAAPHHFLGEVPIAFVTLRGTVADAEQSLRAFCATRLTGPKVPARVLIESELPRLAATGKIDRQELRERAALLPAGTADRA